MAAAGGRVTPSRAGAAPSPHPGRGTIRALGRAFDRAASPAWRRWERVLKARLGRRRRAGRLHLTRAELVRIGEWKTPRVRPRIARNTAAGVRGLTGAAFLVADEARRVETLRGLPGVGLAVASVVLHFTEPSRYPIYDVRVLTALRRLGVSRRYPPTAAGWVAYCAAMRALAERLGVSLRTLDKALWSLGGA